LDAGVGLLPTQSLAEILESALPHVLEVDVVWPLSSELGANKPVKARCCPFFRKKCSKTIQGAPPSLGSGIYIYIHE
jgi:hypothetical protein